MTCRFSPWAGNNHKGGCVTAKFYPVGGQHCGAVGVKDHERNPASARRRIVIYIFMNVPFMFAIKRL